MPAINEKYTIKWEPVGAGVLVTVPEIGASAMAESLDIKAIEEAGHRLIDEHLRKTRKARRKAKASA